jgi:hypothetical protein
VFTFGNQMGIDMLETTLIALQDLSLDKIFNEPGRKILYTQFPKLMEQVCCIFFVRGSLYLGFPSMRTYFVSLFKEILTDC